MCQSQFSGKNLHGYLKGFNSKAFEAIENSGLSGFKGLPIAYAEFKTKLVVENKMFAHKSTTSMNKFIESVVSNGSTISWGDYNFYCVYQTSSESFLIAKHKESNYYTVAFKDGTYEKYRLKEFTKWIKTISDRLNLCYEFYFNSLYNADYFELRAARSNSQEVKKVPSIHDKLKTKKTIKKN